MALCVPLRHALAPKPTSEPILENLVPGLTKFPRRDLDEDSWRLKLVAKTISGSPRLEIEALGLHNCIEKTALLADVTLQGHDAGRRLEKVQNEGDFPRVPAGWPGPVARYIAWAEAGVSLDRIVDIGSKRSVYDHKGDKLSVGDTRRRNDRVTDYRDRNIFSRLV
jgi:hypothetical protein